MIKMNLEQASKKDHIWRAYALKITGDKNMADDVVQDMYLKIYGFKKELNDFYIFMTIKSIFYDKVKKKDRYVCVGEWYFEFLESSYTSIGDIDDEEKEIIDRYERLPFHQKELIIESYTKSLRQIQKEFNINYGFVNREIKKARKNIFENESSTKR